MSVRIAHVSDIHFGGQNKAAVAAARERILAEAPDLTVVSGDLTLVGDPAEFDAARAWVASLPRPVLVTPGNHDTPYYSPILRAMRPWDRYRRAFGDPRWGGFAGEGLTAVAFNSARGMQPRLDWSKGAVSPRQAVQAADAISRVAGLRVVACHHPLMELVDSPVTGAVHGGPEAIRRLSEAGADLILTGHVHVPFVSPTPFGDGQTLAVGAGTLSLRERGCPAGFNLIEADERAIKVVALGFEQGEFRPWRTWEAARRQRPAP